MHRHAHQDTPLALDVSQSSLENVETKWNNEPIINDNLTRSL